MYIELSKEECIELLERRRSELIYGDMPDEVWDFCIEQLDFLDDDFILSDPMTFVDNLIINSDYGLVDDYKHKYDYETDEELEEMIKNDPEVLYYDGEYVGYDFYGLIVLKRYIKE